MSYETVNGQQLYDESRGSQLISQDRLPTRQDVEEWQAAYRAVAPEPGRFDETAASTTAMVHEMPPWSDEELRALRTRSCCCSALAMITLFLDAPAGAA